MSGSLIPNIVVFGRLLRKMGFPVSTQLVTDFTHALEHVSVRRRDDVYFAARSLFVQRHEDFGRFDDAFNAFWRARGGRQALDLRSLMEAGSRRKAASGQGDAFLGNGRSSGELAPEGTSPAAIRGARLAAGFSQEERLRRKDFADLGDDEVAAVQAMIRQAQGMGLVRRSRRLAAGRGPEMDLRRTLRLSLRHGGEWFEWAPRRRLNKTRPMVVLADISGSMAAYSRLILMFVYALARGLGAPLEAFVFGTRLSRVTRPLISLPIDDALDRVASQVQDWSGGTRIGAALHDFNLHWPRRVLAGGAVVLLISDGWDRGDPELLADEMSRLQRNAHRLIWLNPLLGTPGYRPLTGAVQAALPHVDEFRPAHSLASLDDLARSLSGAIRRRPTAAVGFPMGNHRGE